MDRRGGGGGGAGGGGGGGGVVGGRGTWQGDGVVEHTWNISKE